MHRTTKVSKLFSCVCLAVLINLFTSSFADRVRAETNSNNAKQGFPIRQVGGGTRDGHCSVKGQSLTALIPNDSVGMTTKDLPELFFYLPKTSKSQQVEFVLRDYRDRLVYENTTSIEQNGIVKVNVPASQQLQSLETNRDYHWYLSMICDPQDRSKDMVVEGWIKRVAIAPNISQQLEQLDPLERVNLYQIANIWYDALSILVNLKSSNLNNGQVPEKWQELLGSVGLENLSQEPIIN
jgi:hypothetical protein